MSLTLLSIVAFLLQVFTWIIIAQAILSWLIVFNVINTHNDFVRSLYTALQRITDPVYRPIRRMMPDFGGLDLSPMVVLLILIILRSYILPYLAAVIQTAG
ncbi:YggT family protein [Sphingomonas azotifigens]|uniref:YggT family protein n=1 Tax=Sphingomonas azotifigens TaxID=330920 RepID=UPI000A02E0A6|nr:YggT family protein [Sphingomonas azotifigens]